MLKPAEVDFSSKMVSDTFAAFGRSNLWPPPPDDGQKMLSFSSPAPDCGDGTADAVGSARSIAFSICQDETNTGNGGSGLRGSFSRLKGPFTPSQWMELEHQALIYKHIVANVPVPSNLLVPLKRSLYSYGSPASYASNFSHVKSIDKKHLLDIGLEGFYGESMPEKKQNNPGGVGVGTDFVSNNYIPQVDFATIHIYPDQWLPSVKEEAQVEFVRKWIRSNVEESETSIGKPSVVAEFGNSLRSANFSVGSIDEFFNGIYNDVYKCAARGGACGGALFWQVMAPGMGTWSDGYQVVLENSPSMAALISQQSRRISALASNQ